MTTLHLARTIYDLYIRAFRLYVLIALVVSLFIVIPIADGLNFTTVGYHLAVFEAEFYTLLILINNFRPSRFQRVILKSYNEKPSQRQDKKSFFWTVYLITLLVVFGVPLLLCYGYIVGILNVIMQSNEFIISHAAALIPVLVFLTVSLLRLWADRKRSVDEAKSSLGRTLYILFVTVIAGLILFTLLYIIHIKPNLVTVMCLAFNAALIWTGVKLYLKNRESIN